MSADRDIFAVLRGGPRARPPHAGGGRAQGTGTVSGGAQIRALLVANGRYWVNVAPVARAELARWRELAGHIENEGLRELALAKLTEEAFNAEVPATLATLAPRRHRTAVVKAIMALEVLFDYLDGRTEALFKRPLHDVCEGGPVETTSGAPGRGGDDSRTSASSPERGGCQEPDGEQSLAEGRRLSEALAAVISGEGPGAVGADGEYIQTLWRYGNEHASTLPSLAAITPSALAAASRCAEAQLRLHAAAVLGDEQLRRWAQAREGSGLGWREYIGGCASSVLAMHALLAAAARPETSEADAQALDDAYAAICAVITTLDSLVDESRDRRAGEVGYVRLYEGRSDITQSLRVLISEALARAGQLRQGAHHAMTLAGVAAYYTTHPGAADTQSRAVCAEVRTQLAPAIWPALAVLRSWRAAKRARGLLGGATQRAAALARSRRPTGEQRSGGG